MKKKIYKSKPFHLVFIRRDNFQYCIYRGSIIADWNTLTQLKWLICDNIGKKAVRHQPFVMKMKGLHSSYAGK